MIKHKVIARHKLVKTRGRLHALLIKNCVDVALDCLGADAPCEVSVLITGDRIVQKINKEFRGIDRTTDVLSFPMHEFSIPGWTRRMRHETDPESGLIPLGEIVLSAEKVARQARKFRHSLEQETAYLTIHSVLHLLGYDHMDAARKKQMRAYENLIMRELGFLK